MSAAQASMIREKRNWLIHLRYLRQEYTECLKLIEAQLKESNGLCEYALYVKGLITRIQGNLEQSLQCFQACTMLSPLSVANLKQVGRTLYLLGRHKNALEIYEDAKQYAEEDWELSHNAGQCHMYLKNFDQAEECFMRANVIQRHDSTYLQLGRLYTIQEKYSDAIDTYVEALEFSPENPELLTTVGLLFLRMGENKKAFDYLGSALTVDPRNPKTILAAGSIMQDDSDWDVALSKYRVAAVQTPNSAQLWNNVGMCFFGKQNYIAAISCLRRALYLAPFEWIIAYNLGIVFMHTEQYASAFHYLSASINLKQDFAASYMHLAITLNRLDDFENACAAYDKALSMEQDHVFELNYAVTLFNNEEFDHARAHLGEFERIFAGLDAESQKADPQVLQVRDLLTASLQQ
uniref:Bardet-Biedl syndrome 4 protein homolog n=1 Tax=Neobodo designis TaxID=312471 RepID=A0A7S1QZ06_NEODS|mmetsp:Transcript_54704/g.168483  ORF Transcript_54704/g.168483 Transcript_54704/m.168483 type:complete len:407 (+) Transcript_54704:44-1264(+)|eukprot:CAMPEP_0174853138 /NCGR_PEP_ID=MMETSP1114-20130205/27374_1 /TAXON_ID=312471 /ORGANISM="Neobodo designis, Strain CCAP 1951/1" /LENGTH=406 /DNA_ID=CAMNT_0016087759 /DNA_START=43 /DNA_END=1263 /DNA_ORIENTATION=-